MLKTQGASAFGSFFVEPMDYMDRALSLARMAQGRTSPNPAVGAVVVRDNEIVGEGFTQPPGSWHAEVMALRQAGDHARGATMYVTLEPCCHYGRTPPCTEAIIAHEIAEVRVATLDPNPLVRGKGIRQLEDAGIRVHLTEDCDRAVEMVEGFTKHVSTGMPFFILKWAMTLDGKIATRSGDSKWITSEDARALVHDLRDACDAVMVGVGTVIADDPQLTVRVETGRSHRPEGPLKVVVDTTGRIPLTAQLLDPKLASRTLVAVTDRADPAKIEKIRATGAKALVMPEKDGLVDLAALGRELGRRGMVNVLAEGGGTLLASLISGGLADKVYAFIAPKIIGGRAAITPVEGEGRSLVADAAKVRMVDVRTIGGDVLIVGYLGGDNVHGNS